MSDRTIIFRRNLLPYSYPMGCLWSKNRTKASAIGIGTPLAGSPSHTTECTDHTNGGSAVFELSSSEEKQTEVLDEPCER